MLLSVGKHQFGLCLCVQVRHSGHDMHEQFTDCGKNINKTRSVNLVDASYKNGIFPGYVQHLQEDFSI